MQPTIVVESLRPIQVLYKGDVYDLACLLLKLADARTRGTTGRSRPTVHGLATAYARLVIDLGFEHVEAVLRQHGLWAGAVVEWDRDSA